VTLPLEGDLTEFKSLSNNVEKKNGERPMKSMRLGSYVGFWLWVACSAGFAASLPSHFDLRNVSGNNYVTSVKKQEGGTCWTHGAIAAIEGNLMKTGAWTESGESGEAALAEYHLDWWNGFNRHFNADIAPTAAGLTEHQGGDYRVATAYLARGGGAVRKEDAQSYLFPPEEHSASYHYFYVRDVDWLTAGADLSRIDDVKKTILTQGAIGTALSWNKDFYSEAGNSFYQPPTNDANPNHAVTIVGWDDERETQAPKVGAWLVKNSWGTSWGDEGFFWISYYDKASVKHPEMGAVSFNHVEPMQYHQIYYHDYHGWRDTKVDASEAFNAFVAKGSREGNEIMRSVSFYTAADHVRYTVKVYGNFDGSTLSHQLARKDGAIEHPGHHTVDLTRPIALEPGQHFYVYLKLSSGGQPFDRTSEVPVLLGSSEKVVVQSTANPGESFYLSGSKWIDLTHDDKSANFCMKALTVFE
jgi:C1A family cysteine protease